MDHGGVASQSFYRKGYEYDYKCGNLLVELLDSLYQPFSENWVTLDMDPSNGVYTITATPVSVTNELQTTHTLYVKTYINPANTQGYTDSDIPPLLEEVKITVLPSCAVSTFSYPTGDLIKLSFNIKDTADTYILLDWIQTPDCGFAETLTVQPFVESWISVNGREVYIDPSIGDGTLRGTTSNV